MDAPYRESAAADGKSHGPMRVLLREYRWPPNPRVLWASAPFLAVVLWQAWSILSSPDSAKTFLGFPALMTFGLMGVSILYIMHRAYGGAGDAVRIYEDGVTMQREGAQSEMRWDDAATLTSEAFRDEAGRAGQRHVLRSVRGTTMMFTHALEGIDDLAAELRERVAERALPRAVSALRSGAAQAFGPVRVERAGLAWNGGPLVPWREVGLAQAEGGALTLRHAEGVERFDRLPNAHVAAALIEHARV
jgi:hypothetical protein